MSIGVGSTMHDAHMDLQGERAAERAAWSEGEFRFAIERQDLQIQRLEEELRIARVATTKAERELLDLKDESFLDLHQTNTRLVAECKRLMRDNSALRDNLNTIERPAWRATARRVLDALESAIHAARSELG